MTTSPLRSLPRISLAAAALLASAQSASAARNQDFCAKDPYADPKNDVCNPLRYVPTQWASILSMSLYFVVSLALTYRLWRHGKKWMLALVIGGFCEGIGLMFRIPFRANLHSSGLYILLYLFTVLSPCAFLAVDYIILGRLSAHLDGHRHLRPFNPRFLTRIFVGSDIVTFCIQAAGGGLSTSQNPSSRKAGGNIFLAGLALQLVSFAGFTALYVSFGWRMRKNDREVWDKAGWKPLYWALGWTCIGFLTRSVYRTIELSEGYTGHLATTEWYFYVFDILPLWLGISAYIFFWPPRYINDETYVAPRDAPVAKDGKAAVSGGSSAAGEDIAMADAATTPKAAEAGVESGRAVMA